MALVAMISFSSCNSDDQDEAMVLSGEWKGDWNMWYIDDYGVKHYAYDTYLKLVPSSSYSTRGYGIQEDYYRTGRYRYLWYKFNWEVRNGILYLEYPYDHDLDTFIRDYSLSNDYFSGYFGNSSKRFRLVKLTDWYSWTPEFYAESDYYGWSVYSSYSKEYENGAGAKKYESPLPKIVKRGRDI